MKDNIISEKDPKEGIDILLDTMKQFYEEFEKVKDPILQRQKLEFDLFYNDDLKYRKICLEIDEKAKTQTENLSKSDYRKYMTESNEIYSTIKKGIEERERYNVTLHRAKRMKETFTFLTWISLFIGAKVPLQQSATMFKKTSDLLDSQADSLQSDIRMDNEKIINDLSEEEIMAFNFNMARPFREYWTKQQIEILKPFKSRFEGIPLDLELIDKINGIEREEVKKKQPSAKVMMAFINLIDERAKIIPKDSINNVVKFTTLSNKIKELFNFQYAAGTLKKEQYTLEGYSVEVYNLLTEWEYNTEALKYKNRHNL